MKVIEWMCPPLHLLTPLSFCFNVAEAWTTVLGYGPFYDLPMSPPTPHLDFGGGGIWSTFLGEGPFYDLPMSPPPPHLDFGGGGISTTVLG